MTRQRDIEKMEKMGNITSLNYIITSNLEKNNIRQNAILALARLADRGTVSYHSIAPLNFALRNDDHLISGNAAMALSRCSFS